MDGVLKRRFLFLRKGDKMKVFWILIAISIALALLSEEIDKTR